jgi:hypothetical protein
VNPWTSVLIGISVLAGAAPVSGQSDTTRAAARRFVGCYAVRLGPWSQPFEGNPSYHTPPDTVMLDSVLVDGPLGGPGFRLHPHIAILTRYHTVPARWWPVGTDSVRLVWTSGFGGVRIHLAWGDSVLRGRAQVFSDVIRVEVLPDGTERRLPWSEAAAELSRISCR